MLRLNCAATALIVACAVCVGARGALGHGFVGDRFFPPTIVTDDPFATDELSFPEVAITEQPGNPQALEVNPSFEFDKEIFPQFSIGIADDFIWQKFRGGPTVSGWDDLSIIAVDELWHDPPHEAIISVGLVTTVGDTGSQSVGSDTASTFVPTLYFGKGFGDLPQSVWPLKPFAMTGTIGQSIPTTPADPHQLQLGFALEYSMPYLEQVVMDVGMPKPFKDMIPLVEFTVTDPEDRGQGGQATGTICPGVLWETHYMQIGAEAIIPVNGRTGNHIGGILSVYIFIDDIFPHVFGHPLFGGN
jgi:hypothetical protein